MARATFAPPEPRAGQMQSLYEGGSITRSRRAFTAVKVQSQSCRLAGKNRVIDLQAHWWEKWVAPVITLAVAAAIARLSGMLVRRRSTHVTRVWRLSVDSLGDSEAVARTFQVAFLTLTTLTVLCFTSRSDRLTDLLYQAYACA